MTKRTISQIGAIGDFHGYTERYAYVSFDLFDTLIRRHLLKVNEVHDTVSAYVLTQIGKRRSSSPFDLTLLRYRISDVLKAAGDGRNQEPLIDAVWDRLLRRDVPDAVERATIVGRVVSFELELELANLRPVPGAVELLTKLRGEGRSIVGISDMYFDRERMQQILEKVGILDFIDHLYVSAEVQRTKQTGDLFRHVLNDLGLAPAQMIHVGDNLRSDVERATEIGIKAMLVDQPQLLEIERPAYGRRTRIEEEVADLVKMHLFSLLLDGQERKLDQIYFMARDGCAIGAFLDRWKSPLIARFMPAPPTADLYLNRLLSCWGGIDFGGEWLRQAVDLALWLHHDAATPEELCAIFGLGVPTPALGTATLRAGHDTGRIVAAFTEAKLQGAIKAAIIKKRGELVRYLDAIGFFDTTAVAFSDVGYSGTVSRDLNNLFLNRAAEEGVLNPPAMLLSLIATSDNLAANRSRAYPFVEFATNPVLPAEKLPQSLKASFAWLEFFFKHPTLMPILRFTDSAEGIAPELRHNGPSPDPIPSERVAEYSVARDEDIVLLWTVALNFTGQIIDPIIDRFANPDPETMSQMRDEVFEQHSVQGTRRSIFLTIPGARVEAISQAAQQGDYWIPGSIAASAAAPTPAPKQLEQGSSRFRRGLTRWFRSFASNRIAAPVTPPDSFDPDFYRDFYADLRHFTTVEELWTHFVKHGRAEDRLPTRDALVTQLEAEFETMPPDFDGRAYLRFNADLSAQIDSPVQALDHYMRFGRHEGRRYLAYDPDLTDAFEQLRANGSIALTADEEVLWARGENMLALFLRRHHVRMGAWLSDLDAAEFKALHHEWCGPIDGTAACIVALLERGLARCPSLSLQVPFDVAYYRRQLPELEQLDPEDLYRHYLNFASREGLQPSEQVALRAVWGQTSFPGCLDWERYRAQRPALRDAPRAAVLAAFIDDADRARLDFIDLDSAAAFLEFLAIRTWRHHGRTDEAEVLLEAALAAGGGAGRIRHLLGDLALQLGQSARALAHFRLGARAPDADMWSSFHAARLLLDRGDYHSALIVLAAGASVWQERAPWRRTWAAAMQARGDAALRHLLLPVNALSAFEEADAFMDDIIARVPSMDGTAKTGRGVLIVTSRTLEAVSREGTMQGAVTVVNPSETDRGDLVAALLACETVVFHETVFSYAVLRMIALARSHGRRVVAWLGDLADPTDSSLGQSIASATPATSLLRLHNLPEFALAARYCDEIVTTLAGCAPLLQRVARGQEIEVIGVADGNRRGSGHAKRVVLVEPQTCADPDTVRMLVEAMVGAARTDNRLFFLVPKAMAELSALRAIAGRWAKMDDDPAVTDFARLLATVDGVLCATDPALSGYSVAGEAASCGVAAFVLPRASRVGADPSADRSEASVELTSATDVAASIVRLADGHPPAPRTAEPPLHRGGSETTTDGTQRSARRILFANVFFAPQVIGGATRVLKDNVDYLLDHHEDEFDIAVFTADEQNDHSGEWRIDAYRGVPVYRVATPQELNMDWRAENVAVGTKFQAVVAAFKPDIVHIHCLQRLSVTVAEACRASGVPYILTLHDAWWISDFPFLSDAAGMPITARHDYYDQERLRGVGITRSVLRAERLRAALLAADRRLAVSERFAKIYRAAGIPCETVENGVSRIEPVARAAPGDRVELCHVGGLQYHKGAYLIEAALRNNRYENLHFTVVDLARGPNQDTRTVWGTTPVTITGKMSTAELARFYAKTNVLLAPSTWPESYGLVSREALGHGLWVIASKEGGAMADPVIDGVNGFVVSIADTLDLARALSVIDLNAATYRLPPPVAGTVRSADDQSRELIDIYRSMMVTPLT